MRSSRSVPWGRWIFYAVCALVAAWLAWRASAIWFPVAIAAIIAIVLDPTVDRLENRGIPRALATGMVFLLFLGGAALAIVLLSPAISTQASAIAKDLSGLFPKGDKPNLVPMTKDILVKLDAHPALRDALLGAARAGTANLSSALNSASTLALAWAPNLMWFVVVPVLAFYILTDFHRIYAKGILLVPSPHRPFAQSLVSEISAVFASYLRGLSLICFLLGCSIAALLCAFGNPYWQLLGVLGGLLYAIPVVGSLLNVCLVVLVTLVSGSPSKALMVGGALLVLTNGIFDQVVTPRILGKQVGLHPILTILALLIGYQAFGITGMLVAVPLAASVQTVVVLLIPKLGMDLELKPLEELHKEEETIRRDPLAEEAEPPDEHFYLQTVVEHVETAELEAAAGPWDGLEPAPAATNTPPAAKTPRAA